MEQSHFLSTLRLLEKVMPGYFFSEKLSIMPTYYPAKVGLNISPVRELLLIFPEILVPL